MTSDSAHIKKIAPYPIYAQVSIAEGQPGFQAEIVKLTDFGFIARTDTTHFYKVGEDYKISFAIPLTSDFVRGAVKVVKTYDAIEPVLGTTKSKQYTVEMHFTQISENQKRQIRNFLVKIGQTK